MALASLTDSPLQLSVNQTPVSRAVGAGKVTTGPFFAPKEHEFQGPHDLVGNTLGGANVSAGASGLVLIALLGLALLARGRS